MTDTLTSRGTVADELAAALAPLAGGELPVRLTAWDGSTAGPPEAPHVILRSPAALRRLLWQPGELGAAQAYVTGELDVSGDLADGLARVRSTLAARGVRRRRLSPSALARAVKTAGSLGALGLPPEPPASQARLPRGLRGRLHVPSRDRWAIAHHYDLSNDFYALILDESMAYSCAYWTPATATLEDAQAAKLSLVCRKLGLGPGSTLLDVGCGWGSLSLHAAAQFGARVVGLTISAEQKKFVDARIRSRGLSDLVEIRLCDYRNARGTYDAVASLEMGEHVGEANYPTYVDVLRRSIRPGGRVLVQQMSRRDRPGGGPFIESFIAPDMHMRPVGATVGLIEGGGLEVRDVHALREHYVWTVDAWLERFEARQAELTALVGEEVVRVWRLYLVGGRMAFADGRMGVDQILAVRPGAAHDLPAERSW